MDASKLNRKNISQLVNKFHQTSTVNNWPHHRTTKRTQCLHWKSWQRCQAHYLKRRTNHFGEWQKSSDVNIGEFSIWIQILPEKMPIYIHRMSQKKNANGNVIKPNLIRKRRDTRN